MQYICRKTHYSSGRRSCPHLGWGEWRPEERGILQEPVIHVMTECVSVCVCNPSRAPEQAGLALHSLQAATYAPGLVRQYTETPAKLSHTLTSSIGGFCCVLLTLLGPSVGPQHQRFDCDIVK